ncbi:hypothetical protein MAFF241648_21570 [Ralstonia solanacearum]|nr:hypothetical protein MAFF241648_21570 [Ralstonia solanacearum]
MDNATRMYRAIKQERLHIIKKCHFEWDFDAKDGVDGLYESKAQCLSYAATIGNLEIVKYFVSKGADVAYRNSECLQRSICSRSLSKSVAVFNYLVSVGADPLAQEKSYNAQGAMGLWGATSTLYWAAQFNNVDIVKACIEVGCDVSFNNHCAFKAAAENKSFDVMAYLLREVLPADFIETSKVIKEIRDPLWHSDMKEVRDWFDENEETIVAENKIIAAHRSLSGKLEDKKERRSTRKI